MIEARLTLQGDATAGVGRERIHLLEAVAREGSISAGAKAVGLTYKAAWDALDAMANLFGRPLLVTHTGGRAGGGAALTATGRKVIDAFHRLESEMASVARRLESELDGTGISGRSFVHSFLTRTSARNALRGTITAIKSEALLAEIAVSVSANAVVRAVVTRESLEELGLFVGREVVVLVKAPFVTVSMGKTPPAIALGNCLPGHVARYEISGATAEVVLDIGGGKTLVAVTTADSARTLDLEIGKPACGLFTAQHVILAID